MPIPASYFDGRSSDRHPVVLSRDGALLRISGAGIDGAWPIGEVQSTPPLGRVRRTLRFPDGASCEVEESRELELLLHQSGRGAFASLLHRWEKSLVLAAGALLLTALVVWAFIQFGIPPLAKRLAHAIPVTAEKRMGEETLAVLDQLYFEPSTLPTARQEEVRALFARMQQHLPASSGYRLELRASKALGANALALPSGIIIATDDFITLAANDDEIAAVLAHEFAHVHSRHALRQLLQNSAVSLLVASLTGDLTSVTALAATLPTALVNARYSRQFEEEADDQALDYLSSRQIPVERYADILRRLQQYHSKKLGTPEAQQSTDAGSAVGDLFSTHPETEARIRRALERRAP